jgi:hypothetical protein
MAQWTALTAVTVLKNVSWGRQVAVSKPHEGSRMSVHEIDCHQRRPFWEGAMVRYRSHSIEFKRQACSRIPGRRALKGLARRHDISRNLVRLWVAKYEAGELAEEVETAR